MADGGDLAACMPAVARALLGDPNPALSDARQWRWGRRGSLSIDPARGLWWDFEAGTGGGVIELVAHVQRCDRQTARLWLDGARLPSQPMRPSSRDASDDRDARRLVALALWNAALPPADSLVAAYLAGRGLAGVLAHPSLRPVLRYAPVCPYGSVKTPAMLALLTGIADAQPQAVRRTALLPDGRRRLDGQGAKLPHKALGPCSKAVVRLAGPDMPSGTLAVCEGLETGLSLLAAGIASLWACLSAGTLRALPVLPAVQRLMIFADHDTPGLEAARHCARRWVAAGRDAVVRYPETPGQDFNDVWLERRHER